jgi:hypothetical protein
MLRSPILLPQMSRMLLRLPKAHPRRVLAVVEAGHPIKRARQS